MILELERAAPAPEIFLPGLEVSAINPEGDMPELAGGLTR